MIQPFSFQALDLSGAYLIQPFRATDARGAFIKDYNIERFQAEGIPYELKEVFYTVSRRGVLRGMHFQLIRQPPKMVRCIRGHGYDVIVDLRPGSGTFGRWRGFDLTGENTRSLLIPAWFGHGYLVLEDSVVSYKCAETFLAEGDSGIRYDDPELGIAWPFDRIGGRENLIVSEKDENLMSLREYIARVGSGE